MAVQLRKPILMTGVGLSFLLWMGSTIPDSFLIGLGEWGISGAIAIGTGIWWWKSRQQKSEASVISLPTIDAKAVKTAIAKAQTILDQITTDAPKTDVSPLQHPLNQLLETLNRDSLQVAIAGGKSVGKTRLKEVLSLPSHQIIETPALYQKESHPETIEKTALSSEIVIFVVNGDLTDSEYQTLQKWQQYQQKLLVVFNKKDHYSPEEQAVISKQLRTRLNQILPATDIISAIAAPAPMKVRKFQADSSYEEWQTPAPEVETLKTRLNTLLSEEKQTLLYQSTWRKAYFLQKEAKALLNDIRRQRALPYIDQYQWVAAGTAFANPVSSLDLLATVAINTQLVFDLGKIYQQKFSWQQAQTVAGTLGKQMVQLGLVEFSTQTMTSLLKTNVFTYVAGGTVQGFSAAYLTRIAGLSLIEYFQEQEISQETGKEINLSQLQEKLQQVFQNNQRSALLNSLIQQGKDRLFNRQQLPKNSV